MSDTTQTAGNTPSTGDAQPGSQAMATSDAGAAAPASTFLAGAPETSQQANDGQTAGQSTDAASSTDGDGTEAGDKPAGAPEKYEFKVDGDFTFQAEVLDEFSTVAKELNLPQDAAQKVLDKLGPAIAQRNAAAITQAMERASTEWAAAVRADKDLGGDKLEENLAVARKAVDAFGSPELRALLAPFDREKNPKGTGLGNHPELIRAFYKAGKAISEDRFVPGGVAPAKGDRNPARALYPNQPA